MAEDPRALVVQSVPTAPVATSYYFDVVTGKTTDDEDFVRVVLSFATPQGVTRLWFEADALARFCTQGIDVVKEARQEESKAKLIVAKGQPLPDLGSEAAQRAAEQVVKQMGLKPGRG